MRGSQTNGTAGRTYNHNNSPFGGLPDSLMAGRFQSMVENWTNQWMGARTELMNRFDDSRRDINKECGYPATADLTAEGYRELFDREPIARKVVEFMAKECWQMTPFVFEDEDTDKITPFEEGWDGLSRQLRGERSWFQDEKGSATWEHLKRLDINSGLGFFGLMLIGINDGKHLEQPVYGVVDSPLTNEEASYMSEPLTVLVSPKEVTKGWRYNPPEASKGELTKNEQAQLRRYKSSANKSVGGILLNEDQRQAYLDGPLVNGDLNREFTSLAEAQQYVGNVLGVTTDSSDKSVGITVNISKNAQHFRSLKGEARIVRRVVRNSNPEGRNQYSGSLRGMTNARLRKERDKNNERVSKELDKAWRKPEHSGKGAGDVVKDEGEESALGQAHSRHEDSKDEMRRRGLTNAETSNVVTDETAEEEPRDESGRWTSKGLHGKDREIDIGPEAHAALHAKVKEVETRRDWGNLPADYKASAIKQLKETLKPYFRGKANNEIKARGALAKADEFDHVRKAIDHLRGGRTQNVVTDETIDYADRAGEQEDPNDRSRFEAKEKAAQHMAPDAQDYQRAWDRLGDRPTGGTPWAAPGTVPNPNNDGDDEFDRQQKADPVENAGGLFGNRYVENAEDEPRDDQGRWTSGGGLHGKDRETDIGAEAHAVLKAKVTEAETRKAWDKMPSDFKLQAIKKLKDDLKPYFRGKANNEIKARGKLAKAEDFVGVHEAVDHLRGGRTQNELTENKIVKHADDLPRSKDDGIMSRMDDDNPGYSLSGTDQQYFGVIFGPSEQPAEKPSKEQTKVLFLRCFTQELVQIVRYEWDIRNPRFGMPVMYRVTLNDPRVQYSGVGLPLATVFVHWSRVIHVAKGVVNSEIFGTPEMQPVLDPILDIRKVRSASAEGYWKSCFAGLSFETHPSLGGDVNVDLPGLQSQVYSYLNSLQRFMVTSGMEIKTLAPTVVEPTPYIDKAIEAICIQKDCPVRCFKGAERGELASSQDDSDWNGRVDGVRNSWCTPRVIVPFIDRLIMMGCLPEPEGYSVKWPDPDARSDKDKATIALTKTQALVAYVGGNCESIVHPKDYLVNFLEMDEELADSMIETTQDSHDNQETMTMPPQVGGQPAKAAPGTQAADDAKAAATQKAAQLKAMTQLKLPPKGAVPGAPPPGQAQDGPGTPKPGQGAVADLNDKEG